MTQLNTPLLNDPDIRHGMRQVQIFSSLDDEELLLLMDRISLKRYRKGDVILHEDDTNKFMYMILAGKVKAIQTTEDGKEIILAMHRTGESFGELSMIDHKTSPASVIALEETTAALISKESFFRILQSEQKVLENLLTMLCFKLRDSWSRLQMIHSRNAIQRVRKILIQLSDGYGETRSDGLWLNVKLTHQSIADMSGLTREAVTRVFDRLQKEGEVLVNKDRTITLRPSLLKGLSLER